MHVQARLVAASLVAILVVGCGGGSTASSNPDASVASQAPASDAPSSDAPASEAASSAPEPSTPASSTGVCDLVTAAELEAIFDLPEVTTQVFAGPPDTCDIQADSAPLAAFVLTLDAPSFVFDAYAMDPDATAIDGIGDKAAYSPTQGLLVVMKGTSLLSMAAYPADKSDEEIIELLKEIARVAVTRM